MQPSLELCALALGEGSGDVALAGEDGTEGDAESAGTGADDGDALVVGVGVLELVGELARVGVGADGEHGNAVGDADAGAAAAQPAGDGGARFVLVERPSLAGRVEEGAALARGTRVGVALGLVGERGQLGADVDGGVVCDHVVGKVGHRCDTGAWGERG